MLWECWMFGMIHTADGKRHRVNRRFEGLGDVRGGALACLRQRRDGGAPWYGDAVRVMTPLGQTMTVDVPWPGEG